MRDRTSTGWKGCLYRNKEEETTNSRLLEYVVETVTPDVVGKTNVACIFEEGIGEVVLRKTTLVLTYIAKRGRYTLHEDCE
jgi:hypothetical protein